MGKYIIELGEDANMVQVISVTQSGNAHIDSSVYVGYLEQLNSDYINKHFSKLLQDAHNTGYKEGYAKKVEVMFDGEYQRGFEKGKDVRIKGCEGCMYQDTTIEHNPCNLCCNAFLNRWTAKSPIDDGFVRGDVVVDERDGTRGIVVSSENNESNLLYVLFKGYRVPQSVVRKYYKKTGEHYDIDKFLDEIKGDGDK